MHAHALTLSANHMQALPSAKTVELELDVMKEHRE